MSTTTTQDTTAVPTGTWNLDPVHSSIGFAVQHSGVMTFRGDFAEYSAALVDGTLEGTAKVASVRVDDPNLTAHLQSPDFFDAERNPELRFVSRSIERDGDTVSISGDLTLRGETRPVELAGSISGPITDGYGNERLGLDVETTVNRRDYGIDWGADLPSGEPMLADDVTITASLALVRA
jgi:polyisoprenoid-binding protein YceI